MFIIENLLSSGNNLRAHHGNSKHLVFITHRKEAVEWVIALLGPRKICCIALRFSVRSDGPLNFISRYSWLINLLDTKMAYMGGLLGHVCFPKQWSVQHYYPREWFSIYSKNKLTLPPKTCETKFQNTILLICVLLWNFVLSYSLSFLKSASYSLLNSFMIYY